MLVATRTDVSQYAGVVVAINAGIGLLIFDEISLVSLLELTALSMIQIEAHALLCFAMRTENDATFCPLRDSQ
jgi:hypothetical protein